jgi:uncharacterized protein (TIGR02453 family)
MPIRSAFTGFSDRAFDFYERLEDDNSRSFWLANKPVFDAEVKAPMAALIEEFPASLGTFHVFRPNRDVRFSANKEPYKTQHGAVSETAGGSILYVQFSAEGVMAASGAYMMSTEQLTRFRIAIANDESGLALQSTIRSLMKKGLTVSGGGFEPLKTAPRGYAKDHPRIDLLRWKGCIAAETWTNRKVVGTAELATHIQKAWKRTQPLTDWLDTHIGAN